MLIAVIVAAAVTWASVLFFPLFEGAPWRAAGTFGAGGLSILGFLMGLMYWSAGSPRTASDGREVNRWRALPRSEMRWTLGLEGRANGFVDAWAGWTILMAFLLAAVVHMLAFVTEGLLRGWWDIATVAGVVTVGVTALLLWELRLGRLAAEGTPPP